jgi:hypothetical protein
MINTHTQLFLFVCVCVHRVIIDFRIIKYNIFLEYSYYSIIINTFLHSKSK